MTRVLRLLFEKAFILLSGFMITGTFTIVLLFSLAYWMKNLSIELLSLSKTLIPTIFLFVPFFVGPLLGGIISGWLNRNHGIRIAAIIWLMYLPVLGIIFSYLVAMSVIGSALVGPYRHSGESQAEWSQLIFGSIFIFVSFSVSLILGGKLGEILYWKFRSRIFLVKKQ